jgi:hypothetical protein
VIEASSRSLRGKKSTSRFRLVVVRVGVGDDTNPSCSAWGHHEDCYSQAPHTEVAFEVHGHVASYD